MNQGQKMKNLKSISSAFSNASLQCLIVLFILICLETSKVEADRYSHWYEYYYSCKGVYDKSCHARLDVICDDCYNIFRQPQLHQLCRKQCFTSEWFKGCLDVLLLNTKEELEPIKACVAMLHGAEPAV